MPAPIAAMVTARRNRGFTIIELMITVAIIGILSAIALPAYNDYVLRGKFAEATAQLSGVRVRMEQYYQDNRSYESNVTAGTCGVAIPATKYFTYACALGGSDQKYTITATGIAAAGTGGFGFTIDQSNARTTASVKSGWQLPSPNNCWVQKKAGTC